jgi:magnesium transporter
MPIGVSQTEMKIETPAAIEAPDADVELVGSADSTPLASEAEVRIWTFTSSGMTPQTLGEDGGISRGANETIWLDLSAYQNAELERLAAQLELDPSGVAAALAPWQRPGVRAFRDHALVIASSLELDEDALEVRSNELDCFIGESFVITAHSRSLPWLEQVVERAENNAELVHEDPAYLLYIMLDELVDSFAELAQELDQRVDDLETQALLSEDSDFLNTLVQHKRFIYSVNRFVVQHGFLFHGLLRPDFPFVSGETVEGYFAELNERANEVTKMFDEIRQEMLGAFDIYMSSVAHRTNGIMKTLTMISILVLPASAIFGFFGTNFVQLPLFGTIGLIFMFLLLVLLTAGQLVLFRRRGWLS